MKNHFSLISIAVVFLCASFATLIYYPKWSDTIGERVISWDVAGYYQYLPATFIYQDLKQVKYLKQALTKYRFTPEDQQTLPLPNGNRVMKYAMGQAVMYSPFFAVAHIYALNSQYEADGFSTPYELAIEIEILFFLFIGLWFLRLILLRYFSDDIVAVTILGICLGSNYFEYASITGAMTHNNLFAIYCMVIYFTISFYERPKTLKALAIGMLIGLAILTRPTEIVATAIPIIWGIAYPWRAGLRERWNFIRAHFMKYVILFSGIFIVAVWQLIYWKYVSGDWLVYSYGKEGFDWFSPHIEDCLISMKAGWLVYSPIMIFSLIGFYFLYKHFKSIFPAVFILSLVSMYIVFSWQTWWYGGSLGQRALIQYYPLLAFPFAAFTNFVLDKKWLKVGLGAIFCVFIYYNLWLTHQVHRGGLVYVSQMTRPYFWKVVGQYEINREHLKLLDTDELFTAGRNKGNVLYSNDFENEEISKCHFKPIQGQHSPCLSNLNPVSEEYLIDYDGEGGDWVRVAATFYSEQRVWSPYHMGRIVVVFYDQGRNVKDRNIKFHRFLFGQTQERIFIDVACPDMPFDQVGVRINNGALTNMVSYDLLTIESFN